MTYPICVAVVDSFDDLPEYVSSLVLFEVLILDDSVEELASLADSAVSQTYSITRYTFFLSSKKSYSLRMFGWS